MNFLRWIATKFSPRGSQAESDGDVYGLIRRAQTHLELDEYDDARTLLLQAIQSGGHFKDPTTIDYILKQLVATWLFTERYEDGIAVFSEYISSHPKDSAAYSGRAAAFWYAGRLQEAIRDYSGALELVPDDVLSLSGRGQVLAEVGENGRAMDDLNLALQTLKTVSMPDSAWAEWYKQVEAFVHNGSGVALAGLGETDRALDEFETSLGLSPENAWAYHNRAQVYDRAGDREKSSADYQKALTLKNPALNPIRRKQAQARVRELSSS